MEDKKYFFEELIKWDESKLLDEITKKQRAYQIGGEGVFFLEYFILTIKCCQ